jgi:hypothetical protein
VGLARGAHPTEVPDTLAPMRSPEAVLIAQAVATSAMVGLVWFVQIVHYPLFALVPEPVRRRYETAHANRTTWVVAPLMLIEAATALLLVAEPPPGVGRVLPVIGIVLLGLVWASTWLVQVPAHRALSRDPTDTVIRRLVIGNWPRTLLWSARAIVIVAMLATWSRG